MPNTREKLIELLKETSIKAGSYGQQADYLIDNGVTVNEWISVKDRLPHELLTVIIAIPSKRGKAQVMPAYLANGWWKATNDWCYEKDEISHWMPLPQPPKGDGE